MRGERFDRALRAVRAECEGCKGCVRAVRGLREGCEDCEVCERCDSCVRAARAARAERVQCDDGVRLHAPYLHTMFQGLEATRHPINLVDCDDRLDALLLQGLSGHGISARIRNKHRVQPRSDFVLLLLFGALVISYDTIKFFDAKMYFMGRH